MRYLKITYIILLVLALTLPFTACAKYVCDSTCPVCGLCRNDYCFLHTLTEQHCQGHRDDTQQVGIVSVLEKNSAYKNLDKSAESAITDKIIGAVADEYYTQKKNVQLVDVQFGGVDNNQATIVAKVDGSKVVLVKYESEQLGNFKSITDKQAFVLGEAGYTSQTKVDEDKQSEADAKITSAVKSVISKLSSLDDDAKVIQANEIFDGISGDGKDISGFEKYQGVILSEVRQDGTVIAFTYSDGKYNDHVLTVNGKDDLTNDQILSEIKSGEFEITTRTIDPSKTYTAPAVEEKPVVETITVGEIYDQNFANVDFSAKLEEAFQSIYLRRCPGMSVDTMFYAQDGETVSLYVNVNDGEDLFYKLAFDSTFDIMELNQLDKASILGKAGLTANTEVEKTNSETTKNKISTVIEEINSNIDVIANLKNSKVTRDGIINNTEDDIDFKAFGEKLCPDKEVIATYVGALGAEWIDDANMFNTGYYKQFDVVVSYKNDDDVVIEKKTICVPCYNNSTNDSLYNSFVDGEENKEFKYTSSEIETIKNATIAKQNEKQKLASIQVLNEYDIESPDEESAKIVADAVAAYLSL